ncbi:ABC-F family ATP-binding cassette domain-containing protein [Jatrophihabitans sp. GAS493]|uniref:ABC-F family ATP-binding cassette domain-containing protein n=1 Tax=Jatrophihabitans sp. GAS493 TaxID=1907575 RepID=UPI000BB73B8E|nr:ABC-F family ATP-binding cassette domain-containing protein [Jatrophihabitans sp. GAS493]
MSSTLVARGLAAGFGARQLFSELDLVVAPGDVIGLVGANGAGKSTLLRILSGLIPPEEGSVSLNPSTATIGYLTQEQERLPGETVREFLTRRVGVTDATVAMDAAAEGLADGSDASGDVYSQAMERWLALGGADVDDRIPAVAAEVGLGVDLDATMASLSGGQAARAGLAVLLLSRFDIFLLDEPTNDLDLDGLDRLERFVQGLRGAAVIVSHDREFLARTVTSVLELDLAQQQVNLFGGGYDAYLAERELLRQHAREAYDEYADKRSALVDRAQTQRNWMAQGVRNARRKATDPDKFVKNFRAESSEKQAAKARQTQRLLERMEEVAEPRKEWQLQLQIAQAPRAGAVVASLQEASIRRGDFTFGPVTVQLDWADRVIITGPNGGGKSTLLGLLLGQLVPTAGTAALGSGVLVGEVDQVRQLFTVPSPLIDVVGRELPELETADLRTLLAKFGLRADHVNRPAATLSPGERTRASLALLQARGVNLLVLDEPTNHLDLPAIEQLEQALADFHGTLLLVTHDRRMLSTVSTNRHWQVEDGKLSEQ